MNDAATLSEMGMGLLPADFFRDKSGRGYRFHIFEDIVKAGGQRPTRYVPGNTSMIGELYDPATPIALYGHVPWCIEECTYCYYWGKIDKRSEMEKLLKAERAHAELMNDVMGLRSRKIPSIYFGGGTPTVLPRDLLEEHLAYFTGYDLTDDAEVCVESSIGTLNPEKFDVLEKYATRLSIGIQSFNDRLLGMVARTFSRDKALEVLKEAIRRIPSVNIDLLFGLRTQTHAEWMETIEKAIELGTPSVTLYRLEIRDEPAIVKEFEQDASGFPDELACRRMRYEAKKLLESAGYRENLVGWFLSPKVADTKVYRERWEKQTPCVAFGPYVQNYGRDHFYVNVADKNEYISRVEARDLPVSYLHKLRSEEQTLIWIMAKWKSNRPVEFDVFAERFGGHAIDTFLPIMRKYAAMGLIDLTDAQASLTPGGSSLIEWILDEQIAAFGRSRSTAPAFDPRVSLPIVT